MNRTDRPLVVKDEALAAEHVKPPTSPLERLRQQRIELVQAAGKAGLTRLAALAQSQDILDARMAVEMAKGSKHGRWPELAPLTKHEKALVRKLVAEGWARYTADLAAGRIEAQDEVAAAAALDVAREQAREMSEREAAFSDAVEAAVEKNATSP